MIENNIFIHIPKTAGTSIIKKIPQQRWKKVMPFGHDPLFILEINNRLEDVYKFTVVRNPYKRTFSYYKHFCTQNKVECSFLDFLNILKNKIYYKNTPMIVFPQSFFVYDVEGQVGVDKIYKFENIKNLEDDFNISLDFLNKGDYSQEEYLNELTNECIEFIQDYFCIDFFNFNYNLNSYE